MPFPNAQRTSSPFLVATLAAMACHAAAAGDFPRGRHCPEPWFAGASGLVMTRSLPQGEPAASWPGGVELFAGRWFGEQQQHGVEAIYWGVYGITSSPASPVADTILSRNDMVNDAEINWLVAPGGRPEFNGREDRRFTLVGLAGFRFFQLQDVLSLEDAPGAAETIDASTNVNNNLFGGQLGGKLDWHLTPSVRLSAVPKIMLAGNSVTDTTTVTAGGETTSFHTTDGVFSWLGSVDASIAWDVTTRWSLWIGYRLVGVNEIAQASPSWALSPDDPSASPPDASGSTIVHGGFAGFQGRF
jgi:hypothetical protein